MTDAAAVEAAVADAHRRDWALVLAATVRVARDLDLAEDCVQEAYAAALRTWASAGIPDNPAAWLTTTARRRAIDDIRRDASLRSRLPLLVEPTEALDDDTKQLLDDSYNRIVRGRTVIFLPNRLSTLRRSETVVFLHRGKVEAHGTYHDLVKSSSLFRHWEYMRFNQAVKPMPPGTESSSVTVTPLSVMSKSGRMTRGTSFLKAGDPCSSMSSRGLPIFSQRAIHSGCLPSRLLR